MRGGRKAQGRSVLLIGLHLLIGCALRMDSAHAGILLFSFHGSNTRIIISIWYRKAIVPVNAGSATLYPLCMLVTNN